MSLHHVVTTYGNHEHLARLTRTLQRLDAEAGITVQHDIGKPAPGPGVLPAGVDLLATAAPVTWGDGSYLTELLRTFRRALDSQWRWLAVLSGQDYPLRPTAELLAHLEGDGTPGNGPTEGLLWNVTVPLPDDRATWTEEQRRYWFRHHWIAPGTWRAGGGARGIGRAVRGAVALPRLRDRAYFRSRPRGEPGGVGTLVRRAPFSSARPCRKGSDYVLLARPLIEELLDAARREPELLEYFRHTAIPSESWFHTVLGTQHAATLRDELLHFTRFEGGVNPRVLVDDDFDDARASGRFYTRKFDAHSSALLDRIDRELLGLAST
jgi:hypothetical protein